MPDAPTMPMFQPDTVRQKRLDTAQANKPDVSIDKPIRFRVGRVTKNTSRKNYPRKARKTPSRPDLRNPTYY